ncbi:hypothetical protein F5Y04DRAFT_250797 [Hypomontagnella monticulosa]|nr:hypothetical protein F5Y04DRAFT_250797 [Hypomontagnella monticulosa]
MAAQPNPLDVSIQFEPRTIVIGFRHNFQADQYLLLMKGNRFVDVMDLGVKLVSDRSVSMRLPSRVTEIVSSASSCGFYLCFSDEDLASQWQRALLLWKFREGSRSKLYVDRNIDDGQLNKMLRISKPRPRRDYEDPGPAITSVRPYGH